MNQSTCYSCLPYTILDRLREVRRLDAFTPRQIGERSRQLQHPMTLALALQVPVCARALRFIARPHVQGYSESP
jgi:hypothetical protein